MHFPYMKLCLHLESAALMCEPKFTSKIYLGVGVASHLEYGSIIQNG